jgi:hypothetical protein
MSAEALLSRLSRVKRVAPGRWCASCPTSAHKHGDRSRGLSITEKPDGGVLVFCHAGCPTFDVLAAAGLDDWSALFPEKAPHSASPTKRSAPFLPAQVFDFLLFEVRVAAIIAGDMLQKQTISEVDFIRLGQVLERLNGVAEKVYGRP